jgi:hypothetical protein
LVPTPEHLARIPGFRDAYILQRETRNRWNALRLELAQRLASMPFEVLLERWHAVEADESADENLRHAYNAVVRDRLRHTFFDDALDAYLEEKDWETIASYYDLELMLADALAWRAWYARYDEIPFVLFTPSYEQVNEKIERLRAAIPLLQQYRTERNVAMVMGAHRRLGSISRLWQMEPMLLRNVADNAHYARYPLGPDFLEHL